MKTRRNRDRLKRPARRNARKRKPLRRPKMNLSEHIWSPLKLKGRPKSKTSYAMSIMSS